MSFPVFDVTQPRTGSTLVALGNGTNDDSDAIQDRLDAASDEKRGTVYFPPGTYLITKSLLKKDPEPVTIRGEGVSSRLMWGFDGDLFVWPAGCTYTFIHDLDILAMVDMSPASVAFNVTKGASGLSFARIKIDVDDPARKFGSGIRVAVEGVPQGPSLGGEIRFDDLFFWRFSGTGIELRDVTDVRIRGCRFPAIDKPFGSIGIHLAGNTGGVWVENCDLSALDTCILVEQTGDRNWNRELFITGSACDVSNHGLILRDETYVTSTGAWFASCKFENVLVEENWHPHMEFTGGIVFNAGTDEQKQAPYQHHGLVIHGGDLAMSGVMINNNAGVGLTIGDDVKGYTVNGCTFIDNWALGADLGGSCGAIVGNTFSRNGFRRKTGIVDKFLQAATNFVEYAWGRIRSIFSPSESTPPGSMVQDRPSVGFEQYWVSGTSLTAESNQSCDPVRREIDEDDGEVHLIRPDGTELVIQP